jgi:hypothetical protein
MSCSSTDKEALHYEEVRTAGFEISSWVTVRNTGSPLSHRKTCQDMMEGCLKDLGANWITVKWILNSWFRAS